MMNGHICHVPLFRLDRLASSTRLTSVCIFISFYGPRRVESANHLLRVGMISESNQPRIRHTAVSPVATDSTKVPVPRTRPDKV